MCVSLRVQLGAGGWVESFTQNNTMDVHVRCARTAQREGNGKKKDGCNIDHIRTPLRDEAFKFSYSNEHTCMSGVRKKNTEKSSVNQHNKNLDEMKAAESSFKK